MFRIFFLQTIYNHKSHQDKPNKEIEIFLPKVQITKKKQGSIRNKNYQNLDVLDSLRAV